VQPEYTHLVLTVETVGLLDHIYGFPDRPGMVSVDVILSKLMLYLVSVECSTAADHWT
jgi:hypothetical protein